MYSIEVALRRFRGLIRWTSRKYSVLGNFRLSREDLEAEGLLVLVKCCRDFPEGEVRFTRYFKRAWYNRLKDMISTERTEKRTGLTVELLEAFGIPDLYAASYERLFEKLEVLRSCLTPRSFRFLQQLAEPSEFVVEYAWREFCRRNRLHAQGQSVYGYRKFRVRSKHVRKALGMSSEEAQEALREIRVVYHRMGGNS